MCFASVNAENGHPEYTNPSCVNGQISSQKSCRTKSQQIKMLQLYYVQNYYLLWCVLTQAVVNETSRVPSNEAGLIPVLVLPRGTYTLLYTLAPTTVTKMSLQGLSHCCCSLPFSRMSPPDSSKTEHLRTMKTAKIRQKEGFVGFQQTQLKRLPQAV